MPPICAFLWPGRVDQSERQIPLGIWIGFDVMCGVGWRRAASRWWRWSTFSTSKNTSPVLRPAILTAFLGYLLVVVGLLYDLGRPDRLWHPLVMWNPHSVMFEVAWCVTLYSTVLFLEFLPVVFEKFGLHKPLEWIHRISVPLMILGVLLSTLHQSSLGTLFLIVPEKLYPLWYTRFCRCCSSFRRSRWAGDDDFRIVAQQPGVRPRAGAAAAGQHGRVLAVVMSVYLWIRFLDLQPRGTPSAAARNRTETWLFCWRSR
jgi:hypothetical protein